MGAQAAEIKVHPSAKLLQFRSIMSRFAGVVFVAMLACADGLKARSSNMLSGPTDFSGTWKLTGITGDVDKFLGEMGVGWMKRKAAQSMGYGKGKLTQTITMQGEKMTVEVSGGQKSGTMRLIIGGGDQTIESNGKKITVNPIWEGDAVVTTTGKGVTSKRWMKGNTMWLERRINDAIMTQEFTKQ